MVFKQRLIPGQQIIQCRSSARIYLFTNGLTASNVGIYMYNDVLNCIEDLSIINEDINLKKC